MKTLPSQYLLPDQPLPALRSKVDDPMALAYRAAWKGVGYVQSNPLVGLLIEGGPQTWATFLNCGLVNRLHLLQTPRIFGLSNKIPWDHSLGDLGRIDFKEGSVSTLEQDILIEMIL